MTDPGRWDTVLCWFGDTGFFYVSKPVAGSNTVRQDIVRTLKTVSEMDAKTDAGERGVAATLKRLADRLPACTQELCASEVCVFTPKTGTLTSQVAVLGRLPCFLRLYLRDVFEKLGSRTTSLVFKRRLNLSAHPV